ncbi:aminodeoxychorismate synthase, component I [Luteitalea sp. TBR-22]|uniref:aminodeoxychorismate synthase component I n=1 Tax=Luteitalea sp. TBR-22 TaxID=2802971 RepID=UPI001AF117D5|nr:aminodeoxychorismate synthase component I [Luteitalea sp. TBR-22]BCS33029.1 aminodeoxychorismate synthase, component I [Luteitalea sp. TBR-22]
MAATPTARFGTGATDAAWDVDLYQPSDVRRATRLDEVPEVVAWAEAQARARRWVVLLLTYEAAPAFDAACVTQPPSGPVPLAWAAAFDIAQAVEAPVREVAPAELAAPSWAPAIDERRFTADLRRIHAHIAAGDTYQVNYTFPLTAPFPHDPGSWFAACAEQAHVDYAAYVDIGEAVVMSLSPELFLERRGDRIRTRPMKGTARRGRWPGEDARLAADLVASDKARAENVMIVDLLRNDLGRVAVTGSVRVRDLCALERYPTVWQLTSTIDATLRPGTSLAGLLAATFPCGSVTGAPKVRTMELIADLEHGPRGIYTGAIALLRPGGDLVASVPIRTAVLDRGTGEMTYGVGAGITADSDPAEEWAECLAKSRVVRPPAVPGDARLFETMRLEEGRLLRRDAHVARVTASAALFGWPCDQARLARDLDALCAAHPTGTWRARLWLDRAGTTSAEAVPVDLAPRRWRVGLAASPVDPRSPLLFNKTSRREMYDVARATRPDLDDVILWNGRGELTEGTVGNLVVERDGRRITPPVASGLLPGVFRAELLSQGRVEEGVLTAADLARATRVWLVNSLRGWIDIDIVPPEADVPADIEA